MAAASLLIPATMNVQNSWRSLRVEAVGRPGDRNGGRPHRSYRRFRILIATSLIEALRRPVESAQCCSVDYQAELRRRGIRI